jgi:hypothetical protein
VNGVDLCPPLRGDEQIQAALLNRAPPTAGAAVADYA